MPSHNIILSKNSLFHTVVHMDILQQDIYGPWNLMNRFWPVYLCITIRVMTIWLARDLVMSRAVRSSPLQ